MASQIDAKAMIILEGRGAVDDEAGSFMLLGIVGGVNGSLGPGAVYLFPSKMKSPVLPISSSTVSVPWKALNT